MRMKTTIKARLNKSDKPTLTNIEYQYIYIYSTVFRSLRKRFCLTKCILKLFSYWMITMYILTF